MNLVHRWLCRSAFWRAGLQGRILPWALQDADLGEDVLEIGSGPGLATDYLLPRSPRLTALEIDAALAARLARRTRGTRLRVVRGDGTKLPFPEASFSGVACFTMLHHVPSAEAQDRLFCEVRRVLRPGGVFAGTDSPASRGLALIHHGDTYVPIAPESLQSRLEKAGFARIGVECQPHVFRFYALAG